MVMQELIEPSEQNNPEVQIKARAALLQDYGIGEPKDDEILIIRSLRQKMLAEQAGYKYKIRSLMPLDELLDESWRQS